MSRTAVGSMLESPQQLVFEAVDDDPTQRGTMAGSSLVQTKITRHEIEATSDMHKRVGTVVFWRNRLVTQDADVSALNQNPAQVNLCVLQMNLSLLHLSVLQLNRTTQRGNDAILHFDLKLLTVNLGILLRDKLADVHMDCPQLAWVRGLAIPNMGNLVPNVCEESFGVVRSSHFVTRREVLSTRTRRQQQRQDSARRRGW